MRCALLKIVIQFVPGYGSLLLFFLFESSKRFLLCYFSSLLSANEDVPGVLKTLNEFQILEWVSIALCIMYIVR